jgi:hypothetical protein
VASRSSQIKLVTINVTAIEWNGRVRLLDHKGRSLTQLIQRPELNDPLAQEVLTYWHWRMTCQRLSARLIARHRRRTLDAWGRKFQTWATSLRLRGHDVGRTRTRRKFERYKTTTWPEAIDRLWHQGNNHRRYHSRSGWTRWSQNVANNHNKRKGGRYARHRHGSSASTTA